MDDLDLKIELTESAWIEGESFRLLMKPRSRMTWFSSATTVAMAVQLYGHVNTFLIAAWLLVSLVIVAFRVHIKSEFIQHG